MGYLSGQGKVYAARRDANGNALAFEFLGNVPSFELALNVDTLEHKESTSGNRLIDLRLITGQKVDLTLNVQEFTPENLALLLQGNLQTSVSGSVTAEELNGGLALEDGKTYSLKNANVSSLVLTDSAATPVTLTTPAKYIPNLAYGLISAIDVAGFTAPIKAAYAKAVGQKSVDIFAAAQAERWLRLLGINTAQKTSAGAYKRFVLDLYNVVIDPTTGLALINDAVADMQLKGSVLIDSTRAVGAVGGQVGQLIYID